MSRSASDVPCKIFYFSNHSLHVFGSRFKLFIVGLITLFGFLVSKQVARNQFEFYFTLVIAIKMSSAQYGNMGSNFVGPTGMPVPVPGFIPLTTLTKETAASAVQTAADAVRGLPFQPSMTSHGPGVR